MVLGNFHYRGVPLIWFIAGLGPAVIAVGARGVVLMVFLCLAFLLFFLPVWHDGLIWTEIRS